MSNAPSSIQLLEAIAPWLTSRRWFPRTSDRTLQVIGELNADSGYLEPPGTPESDSGDLTSVRLLIIQAGSQLLNVPLVVVPQAGDDVAETFDDPATDVDEGDPIGSIGDLSILDGVSVWAFWDTWLAMGRAVGTVDADTVERMRDMRDQVQVYGGEQSNTSVIFRGTTDETPGIIAKVLRVLTEGAHPDVEVPTALCKADWNHVPRVFGYVAVPARVRSWPKKESELCVATIISELVRDGRDGFVFFVDGASRGEDLTEQARSLGSVTAQMHEILARALPTADGPTPSQIAARVRNNLDAAHAEVPGLTGELVDTLGRKLDQLSQWDEPLQATRIHGDYHLGQTLLSDDGWKILDFEGEPLRPLAERTAPDLPLKGVAGMLRSFDYAMAQARRLADDDSAIDDAVAHEWVSQHQRAFLEGYHADFSCRDDALMTALIIEKAAYESIYEHRMRPDWLSIPLDALTELAER